MRDSSTVGSVSALGDKHHSGLGRFDEPKDNLYRDPMSKALARGGVLGVEKARGLAPSACGAGAGRRMQQRWRSRP
jgi:hypothetical protein